MNFRGTLQKSRFWRVKVKCRLAGFVVLGVAGATARSLEVVSSIGQWESDSARFRGFDLGMNSGKC